MRRVLAMGRLAGGIAHDFNNRLQALRNVLELIRANADDPESVRRWSHSALQVVDRGARLTAQLRSAAGAPHVAARPVEVAPLLRGMQDVLERTLPPLVRLAVEPAADTGSVLADASALEAAVLNLALNAAEAMPQGGRLTIGCERRLLAEDPELPTGEYLHITVADTGTGMSEAVRERAFEPFFTTKPLGRGAGLGLSQVCGFAHQCGGTARIEASSAAGTTVGMLLPALVPPATSSAAAGPDDDDVVVVVAVADRDARLDLCDKLRALGYRAVPAADGLGALAALERHAPAALVVDAALPDMDRAEVVRRARLVQPALGVVHVGGDAAGPQADPAAWDIAALSAAIERARQA